jgi:hypothetical protein
MRLKTIMIPPKVDRPARSRGDTWHDAVDPFALAYSTWLHADRGARA